MKPRKAVDLGLADVRALRRLFSRTKCFPSPVLNCSDGIRVPDTFLNTITDDRVKVALLRLHQLGLRGEGTGLLVRAIGTQRHFCLE